MSDDIKIKEGLDYVEKEALREKKRKEVLDKELIIKDHRANFELQKLAELEKEKTLAKTANYGMLSDEAVEELKRENTEYMLAAKTKMRFMNEEFDDAIPFYRKNLILVGGATGDGKSTTAANIITTVFRQLTKEGRRRRVLVLTNEEKREDVYNRVLCLMKGWSYVNHDKFTDEQSKFMSDSYVHLRQYITVISDVHEGSFGVTTTLEGICRVFDRLIAENEFYDVVILDYYQNVQTSQEDARLNEYQVQAKLARRLDQYKNIYPAPIVVLAQVRPVDDSNTPFKIRIEGSKLISNVCTCTVELIPDKRARRTDWIIHKSRFNEAVGVTIQTGFDRGKHVVYDDAFRDAITRMQAAREKEQFDRSVRMPTIKAEEPNGTK